MSTLGKEHIEITKGFDLPPGVVFDAEAIILEGTYEDELSLFRARKIWRGVLETNFLLDEGYDFRFGVLSKLSEGRFALTCRFLSACGRYAFWRLINHQAPEAQYLIETAHIPHCESRHDDMLSAPDLGPSILPERAHSGSTLVSWLVDLLARKKP